MVAIKNIWKFWGSSTLTVFILLAVVLDFEIGFFFFRSHPSVFSPLDRLMLFEWLRTYGLESITVTWWFFVLLFLLFILTLNTVVCTVDSVAALIKRREKFSGSRAFVLKFAPHVMHVAFVLLLLGHFTSYAAGFNLFNNILKQGIVMKVPYSDLQLSLENLKVKFYKSEDAPLPDFAGKARDVVADILIIDPANDNFKHGVKKKISINMPAFYQGISFHLKNFYPQNETNKGVPYVNLIIRKDPGIRIMAGGIILFTIGLVMYLFQTTHFNLRKKRIKGTSHDCSNATVSAESAERVKNLQEKEKDL
ncbi:MAG: cytochrome c biogenesis protein ResB [Deltaproteobacteria bacterium]|nr:cytochrome c biogenesis protein ResB [Deltaproteobacteria bacterium]